MFKILSLPTSYEKTENIIGKDFKRFIDYCFDITTYFTLTHTRWLDCINNSEQKEIFNKLKPYLYTTISTDEWFASYVSSSDPNIVEVYRTEEGAKKILLDIYDNLYLGNLVHNYNLPEDICFFYKNKQILGTCSHEKINFAFPLDKQMETNFYKFGKWEVVDDKNKDFMIDLSDYIDITEK